MPSFSNPDELFDVVDDQDRVVGQASRREVHAQLLLHRAVHVVIHNRDGEIFLQHRSLEKDNFPGCWDSSCTGHVDAGEYYPEAARRELAEELGWHEKTQPLHPVTKLSGAADTGWEFIQIYLMGPCHGPFALNPEEITGGRWMLPRDLLAELETSPDRFAGGLRHLWREHAPRLIALLSQAQSSKL